MEYFISDLPSKLVILFLTQILPSKKYPINTANPLHQSNLIIWQIHPIQRISHKYTGCPNVRVLHLHADASTEFDCKLIFRFYEFEFG